MHTGNISALCKRALRVYVTLQYIMHIKINEPRSWAWE